MTPPSGKTLRELGMVRRLAVDRSEVNRMLGVTEAELDELARPFGEGA